MHIKGYHRGETKAWKMKGVGALLLQASGRGDLGPTLRESRVWAHREMTGEGTPFFKIPRLSSVQGVSSLSSCNLACRL